MKPRWTDDELVRLLAQYIRKHAILPTVPEYMANRGDLPDESTIRARLGGWTAAWRLALREVVKQPTTPQHQRLIEMYEAGVPVPEIAAELGYSATNVYAVLKRRNVPKRKSRRSTELQQRHIELFLAGVPVEEIAREAGCSQAHIYTAMRDKGVFREVQRRGRHQERSRQLWRDALAAAWPITVPQLAALLYPNHAEGGIRARNLLSHWHKKGKIVRFQRGIYGLTVESIAERDRLLASKSQPA